LKYFDYTINNKKIAKYIGKNIKPNHVRYVKGSYIRSRRALAKTMLVSLRDVVKNDI